MITVSELYEKLKSIHIKLIGGNAGIDKVVEYLTIMELVEKTTRIKQSGFVISTFHAFKTLDEILDQLEWLYEVGVSVIGFHTASYKNVPKEVIKFSNDHGLPLFYIPAETPYYQIFDIYNQLLHDKKTRDINMIYKLNKQLMEQVLSNKSLEHIVKVIGNHINNFVIVLDQYFNLLSYWKRKEQTPEELNVLLNYFIQEKKEILLTTRFTNRESTITLDDILINLNRFTVYPIKAKMKFFGYLLVCEDGLDSTFLEEAMQNALRAISLTVQNYGQMNSLQKEESIKLLEKIFIGDFDEVRKSNVQIDIRKLRQIIIAEPDSLNGQYYLLEFMIELFEQTDRDSFVWLYENKIVVVTPSFIDDKKLEIIRKTAPNVRIGMSSKIINPNVYELRKLYMQAEYALRCTYEKNSFIEKWENIGIEKVAHHLHSDELFEDLNQEVLGPLIEYDKENDSELTKTLYYYLLNFFNLQKTSSDLYIHPNTVKYRLKKIKEIIKMDIHHSSNYTLLILAFKILKKRQQDKNMHNL